MPETLTAALRRVRVWDLPTRLFHWALVLCVLASVCSAKLGGNAMVWHQRFGYALLVLLAFRLLWGLVGGHWSRFSSFFFSPAALLRYLRGRPLAHEHFEVGHNPLGAWSVLLMLLWLMLQIGSGLVADDEIAFTGPLAHRVASETSLAWTAYHKSCGQWSLYGLVGLHVLAIAFYRLGRRRDLIGPMFSGDKHLPGHVQGSRDTTATRVFALTLLGACAAAVYLLISAPAA